MTENNQNSKRIDTCIVPLCPRQLKKRTEHFQGGRISDVTFLTLKEAAVMASRHAGIQITSRDFIRSAELGEIELFISLRRPAKMLPINRGEQTATVIHYKKNDLIKIPFRACQEFLATGFGSWEVRYELNLEKPYQRYMATHALDAGEPAIEVIEANCRVLGHWVHALADNFLKQATPAPQQNSEPAPVTGRASSALGSGKVWTLEKLAEAKAYREKHGTKKTAEHYQVTAQRIRHLLPGSKPQPKGYSAFTHRPK